MFIQTVAFREIYALTSLQEFSASARYYQYYVPVISAIVISEMNSPFNQVRRRYVFANKPVPSNQYIADHLVPPLNRWSDVTWTIWNEKAGDTANNLRYIAHDAVENEATDEIAAYIFAKARNSQDVPYPGLDFGMDSREGRALLGTPNGIGTARILIDRAKELGKRELRVRIFTSDTNGLCMLWDMVPPKSQPRGLGLLYLHRREFYAKVPSPLVKRATREDFLRHKRQGDAAYDNIQRAYARNLSHACESPVEEFQPEALANGWLRFDQDGVLPPDQVWETIFANLPGQTVALTAQQSSLVTVAWEKPFTTRQGLQNRVSLHKSPHPTSIPPTNTFPRTSTAARYTANSTSLPSPPSSRRTTKAPRRGSKTASAAGSNRSPRARKSATAMSRPSAAGRMSRGPSGGRKRAATPRPTGSGTSPATSSPTKTRGR